MNDMDVFLLLTLYRKQVPGVPDEAIRQLLTETFDIPVTINNMAQFLEQPPNTKQLVHALHDRGFAPSFIKDYLQVAQSTVSYHLATEPKNTYKNRRWTDLRLDWNEKLRTNHISRSRM